MLRVKLDAEVTELRADALAHLPVVLADARREDDGVEAAHRRGVRADELADLVGNDVERKLCALVARLGCGGNVAAVGRNAGHAEEAALLVHVRVHLVGVHAGLVHDVGDDRGVNVAAARAHLDTGKGGEAHRGVQHLAVLDRRDGGAVAEVAGDDLRALRTAAEQLDALAGDIAVGRAVRTVAADGVLLVHVVADGVNIGVVGHGRGVERGVEHEDLGRLRHGGEAALNAHDVRAGVQGRKVTAELELRQHLIGEQHRLREISAAVDDAVADGLDLVHGLHRAVFCAEQRVDDDLGGDGVVGHRDLFFIDRAGLEVLMLDLAVDPDTLAETLCTDNARGRIKQLILERAGACVYNEYIHENDPPIIMSLTSLLYAPFSTNSSRRAHIFERWVKNSSAALATPPGKW